MLNRDTLGALIFLAFFTAYAVFAWQIPLLPFEEMDAVNSASIPKVYAVLGLMFSLLALLALMKWKWPPWVVVAGCAGVGWVMGAVGV